ncbi:Ferrous-iron efflux pump FieF [Campylobacter majalis]|uniref:Ferrous-iron efflux pump FieF n=1 Tax=Campylobacter majalis TaxID=2790656 RepID=A0ABN7K439_9BACT|nr:cation diffusion facilitator family transporter [Campylobacter majalis]CAD7286860.1 Ferrous-iron efflux pump FieF [Campylobacter majalis]
MMYFKDTKREKIIIKTAIIGIIVNVILASIKILIAFFSGSIAIVVDAINNLSDAFSSVITIFGSKLSSKMPDENHPYGYGRAEYIGGLVVSVIVLILGINFLSTSIENIATPAQTTFSLSMLVVLFIAIFVKFFIGFYYKKIGKQTNSISLKAVGAEAIGDAIISCVILLCAALSYFYEIYADAYAGIIASLFIIINGILLIKETFDEIVGRRVDKSVSDELYKAINECEIVLGSYDLTLHSYGMMRYSGSVNVEIDENLGLSYVSSRLNRLQIEIFEKYGIYLVFGIYSINLGQNPIRDYVQNALCNIQNIKSTHAFFMDVSNKSIRVDIVIDYAQKDIASLRNEAQNLLKSMYPEYKIFIVVDRKFY